MNENPAVLEWRRAQECLGAARICHDGGFYADAISRSYYAVLHAAKSVLRLHGVDASNHMGVANLFGQVVVAPGLVEGQWGREIRVLRDLRIDADYQVSAAFSEFDSHETCERAQAFVNRIRPLLAGAVPMDET